MIEYAELIQYIPKFDYPPEVSETSTLENIFVNTEEREFINSLNDNEISELVILGEFIHFERLVEIMCLRMALEFRFKHNNMQKKFGVEIPFIPEIELELKKAFPEAFNINEDKRQRLLYEMKLQEESYIERKKKLEKKTNPE